jgi:hypothetical protein
MSRQTNASIILLLVTATASPASALTAMSAEELAKLAQNPIANLISVPFQNNTNYNVVHPDDGPNWQLRFQVQFMFPK